MDFADVEISDPVYPVYARYTNSQEEMPSFRAIKNCPRDKRHVTGFEYLSMPIDLFGDRLGDFVPHVDDPLGIVSAAFAARLRKTHFTGYKLHPIVKILENESRVKKPELLFLEFLGKGGRSDRLVVKGAPNLCPHCGKVPMVCPSCGQINWPKCIDCDEWTLFLPELPDESHPKGFVVKGYPPDVAIVEGKDWDGSDFFRAGASGGVPFVSNRAKEWMEKTHTFPIKFKPALLNIEGVEDKFKEK